MDEIKLPLPETLTGKIIAFCFILLFGTSIILALEVRAFKKEINRKIQHLEKRIDAISVAVEYLYK